MSGVIEAIETWLYPAGAVDVRCVVSVAKRFQSGRLDAYRLYVLIALVAVTAVVTTLAWRLS
jgi:hydrogenase-4 component B